MGLINKWQFAKNCRVIHSESNAFICLIYRAVSGIAHRYGYKEDFSLLLQEYATMTNYQRSLALHSSVLIIAQFVYGVGL